ncbi:MAG: diguanylate cyclase [Candidatus Rokubacteria bacterium]|nr:diguanylate cyclase [Candidatus Rokubacteria bacterium]
MRTVCQVLRQQIRDTDPVGLSPEGVGILLLHVADQFALGIAERLRAHVRHVAIPTGFTAATEHITISVGGACFPRDGQTEAALLTHASRSLDVARRRGGDRVVYDPTAP